MTTEQLIIQTWRRLPKDKQQEVVDFIQSIAGNQQSVVRPSKSSNLGERLQSIRDQIVASSMPLLTPEEVEKEVLDRRGGHPG